MKYLIERASAITPKDSLDDLLNEAIELGYIIRNFEVDRFLIGCFRFALEDV